MAAHLSLLPYWAFGLALAGSFYGGMIWLGAHFRPEFRQSLTEWLQGHRDRSWADSFLALFDTLFDARHASARRLWRSALASVLAVAVLYVLFAHVLGLWHTRTMGQLELWQALAALVMVNIVADYLSLIETRWLLERFRTVRSVAGQAALLVADLVFTGAIVLALLYAFSRLVLGEAPRAIDVLALFSVYSIFFYSTFLTSIWAWLHCASAWFVRLFTRLGLGHILDVQQKPVHQIALVGAGLILLGTLALGPALRAEPGSGASRLDAWLCERDLPSCFLAARASLAAGDTGPTRLFVENACRAEETDGNCAARLNTMLRDDHKTINAIWRQACDHGYARACRAYGYAYEYGHGTGTPDYLKAAELYQLSCSGGDAVGCTNLGHMYGIGRGVEPDPLRAADLYRKGCDWGYTVGCTYLEEREFPAHGSW